MQTQRRVLILAALASLLAAGCGQAREQVTNATTSTTPSVALHLDTGSYTTNASTAILKGTVTPGAAVMVNETYPNGQGGRANVDLPVKVRGGRWSATATLIVDEFGAAFHKTNTGDNLFAVKATKEGYIPVESAITITRAETPAQNAQRKQTEAQQLKQEEANPNSEFNKNERTVEAEATKAKHKLAEEERPYKEAEERTKNLEAKKAEEATSEEAAREQRRLEAEGR